MTTSSVWALLAIIYAGLYESHKVDESNKEARFRWRTVIATKWAESVRLLAATNESFNRTTLSKRRVLGKSKEAHMLFRRRSVFVLLWLLSAALSSISLVRAEEPADEVREFDVLVDDKPAGTFTMTVDCRDSRTEISTKADVTVSILVLSYRYRFNCREVWEGDQLQRVVSRTDDDGKALSLSAEFSGAQSRLIVNRQDRPAQACHWTTTFTRLPAAEHRDRELRVLVADAGESKKIKLQRVGKEDWKTARERLSCTRYRVVGELQADLWFDSAERLVRQKSIESGHTTELRLKSRESRLETPKTAQRDTP